MQCSQYKTEDFLWTSGNIFYCEDDQAKLSQGGCVALITGHIQCWLDMILGNQLWVSLSKQSRAVPDDLRKSLPTSVIQIFPNSLVLSCRGAGREKGKNVVLLGLFCLFLSILFYFSGQEIKLNFLKFVWFWVFWWSFSFYCEPQDIWFYFLPCSVEVEYKRVVGLSLVLCQSQFTTDINRNKTF